MNLKQYIAVKGVGVLFFTWGMFATEGVINYTIAALCMVWCIPEWVQFYYDLKRDGSEE